MVEMLVVFAIMMTLLSLLQPSLKKMTSAADSLTCLNNQRAIGGGYNMYAEDNAAFLPPGAQVDDVKYIHDWRSSPRVITFDEAILNYVRQEPIPQAFIDKPHFHQYKQKYKNDGESVFSCPRHTEINPNLHGYVSRGWAMQRSYVNIGMGPKITTAPLSHSHHYLNNGPTGINWSMQTFELPSPGNTFLMGENFHGHNMIGYVALLSQRGPGKFNSYLQRYSESPHGDLSFNFLYSDGHARNHFLLEFGESDDKKWGPWTMNTGD